MLIESIARLGGEADITCEHAKSEANEVRRRISGPEHKKTQISDFRPGASVSYSARVPGVTWIQCKVLYMGTVKYMPDMATGT